VAIACRGDLDGGAITNTIICRLPGDLAGSSDHHSRFSNYCNCCAVLNCEPAFTNPTILVRVAFERGVKPLYRIHKAVDGTTLDATATAVLPQENGEAGFATAKFPKLAQLNPEGWFIRKTERPSLPTAGTPH
jgi:hypothetical protein